MSDLILKGLLLILMAAFSAQARTPVNSFLIGMTQVNLKAECSGLREGSGITLSE